MTVQTLSVDSGKYATKACTLRSSGNIETLKFLTRMDAEKENLGDAESYSVIYEGSKYLIGRQASSWDPNRTKKSEIHKISTYTAIGNLVGNGDHVNIGIGCPLSIYMNPASRKAYKEYLVPHGKQVNITINRKNTSFIIKRSFVFPESSGVIYLNKKEYESDTVGVVDIGGLNANCCIYENLIPRADVNSMFTLDEGGHILTNRIKAELESNCDVSLSDILMNKILKDGFMHSDPEKSSEIIKRCKQDHVMKIFNECKKNGWPLENMKIIFIGGTSSLLSDEIDQIFPWVDLQNCMNYGDYANAQGFLKETSNRII